MRNIGLLLALCLSAAAGTDPKCIQHDCQLKCPSGFKLDDNGCELCECNKVHEMQDEEESSPEDETLHENCTAPSKVSGRCMANHLRWSFIQETKQCEEFIYGGCGASANNFESAKSCRQTCIKGWEQKLRTKCAAPSKVAGRCNAAIPRWSFNQETEKCEEFTWGGCGQTEFDNRFNTEEFCNSICIGTPPKPQCKPLKCNMICESGYATFEGCPICKCKAAYALQGDMLSEDGDEYVNTRESRVGISNQGALAGGLVAGFVGTLLIIAVAVFGVRRYKNRPGNRTRL